MNLVKIKKQSIFGILELAKTVGVKSIASIARQDLIFSIVKSATKKGISVFSSGVLEIVHSGFGFLRSSENSYLSAKDDVYVSISQIQKFGLQTGDTICGKIRLPKGNEQYFSLMQILSVNFDEPKHKKFKAPFDLLTPLFPEERLRMCKNTKGSVDISGRIIDLISPIGKGQRALIVSPPKSGKTVLLKGIANAITANNPECILIVLLIDERPEEVTDMSRSICGEVISSTFDQPSVCHVQTAEITISKAKRLVEYGHDVVILLDSITRLARAYNTTVPSSGKILTGGVDSSAMHRPKRFFGAARNVEEGGSLTIIATSLIDTGSKMDDVIYEEFKGTGNMEIHMERKIAENRIFPAINIVKSSTRKEELITDPNHLKYVWELRKIINSMDDLEGIKFLLDKLNKTKNNSELIEEMRLEDYRKKGKENSVNPFREKIEDKAMLLQKKCLV